MAVKNPLEMVVRLAERDKVKISRLVNRCSTGDHGVLFPCVDTCQLSLDMRLLTQEHCRYCIPWPTIGQPFSKGSQAIPNGWVI